MSTRPPRRNCDECGNRYRPRSWESRFCGNCRLEALAQQTLSDSILEDARDPIEAHIEKENRRYSEKDLKDSVKVAASRHIRNQIIEQALLNHTAPKYNPPPGLYVDPDHLKVVHLSDWHIGQKTTAEATGGIFHHDHVVATAQVERLMDIERAILRDDKRAVRRTLIVVNGDMVDGDDMRNSQHTEIEYLVMEQTLKCYDLIVRFIDHEVEITTEDVVVSLTGGNHDRSSRKPGNAGLSELGYTDTYLYLLGGMLERTYQNEKRVKIINNTSFFAKLNFSGHKIVHAHGSDIKWGGGYNGIPWNAIGVAADKYNNMLGGDMELLLLAHGHMPSMIPGSNSNIWINTNGSLPGTSEYVQSNYKVVRRPVQWILMLNEHGLVNAHPAYLDVGQIVRPQENNVWDNA